MTWRGKLKVWAPQVVETGASVGCWTILAAGVHGPAAVAVGLVGGVIAVVAMVTSITKLVGIDDRGWGHYANGGCDACARNDRRLDQALEAHAKQLEAVTRDRDELRQAILVLNPKED